MVFFNTKEEVLDIELTPYGKHLLSLGKFKPVYYEFYDDDIVYDSQYFGQAERQSEIQDRIKETKRRKTQHIIEGAETRLKEYKRNLEKNKETLQEDFLEVRKTLYMNFLPLGKSSFDKKTFPSINIKFLEAEIDSVSSSVAISGLPNNLYSINLKDCEYVIYEGDEQSYATEQEILLDISELNTDDIINNFDISVFEIAEDGTEICLYFEDKQRQEKVKNDLLIENEDYADYIKKKNEDYFLQKHFIQHYLEISTDKEIQSNKLCKHLSKKQIQKLKIIDGYDIDCEEVGVDNTIIILDKQEPHEE